MPFGVLPEILYNLQVKKVIGELFPLNNLLFLQGNLTGIVC
jgi:hypothetical protein